MTQEIINIGAAPNDGTGDPIRDAFDKCNSNFTELYAVDAKTVQRKACRLGLHNDNGSSPAFSGATSSFQGIAWVTVAGVEKLFALVHVSGSSFDVAERVRIVEFNYLEDGSALAPVAYSAELNVGHGQDLSAEVVSGNVVLWTTSPTTVSGTGAGKGVSKIQWNGSLTDSGDVTTYLLCGAANSSHRRQDYFQGTPCLSADGNFLIFIADYAGSQGRRRVLIFDRSDVEASGNPLDVDPVFSWHLQPYQVDDGDILQGVASDGDHVYTLSGYYNAFQWKLVHKYDFLGNLIRAIPLTLEAEEYGLDAIRGDATLGNPYRIEPEGITLREGSLLVGCTEVWRTGADIVSYEGENFAYIGDGSTVSPENMRQWIVTDDAAGGAYNSASSYSIGSTVTRTRKNIWAIHPERGVAGELPISPYKFFQKAPSAGEMLGSKKFAGRFGIPMEYSLFSEQRSTFFNAFSFSNNVFSIFDARIGSDNSLGATITTDTSAADPKTTIDAAGSMFLRADADLSSGAGINAYGNNSSIPGQLRFYAYDVAGTTLRTLYFRPTSPAFYPGHDNAYSNGIASLRWSVIYAGTGTINTSDRRLKQDIRDITETEKRVAKRVSKMLKAFRFSDAVDQKSDGARTHFGLVAQDVKAAFEAEGLRAEDYALFCYDEWEEEPEEWRELPDRFDQDGRLIQAASRELVTPYRAAGNRYGLRYDEVFAFVLGALL